MLPLAGYTETGVEAETDAGPTGVDDAVDAEIVAGQDPAKVVLMRWVTL